MAKLYSTVWLYIIFCLCIYQLTDIWMFPLWAIRDSAAAGLYNTAFQKVTSDLRVAKSNGHFSASSMTTQGHLTSDPTVLLKRDSSLGLCFRHIFIIFFLQFCLVLLLLQLWPSPTHCPHKQWGIVFPVWVRSPHFLLETIRWLPIAHG